MGPGLVSVDGSNGMTGRRERDHSGSVRGTQCEGFGDQKLVPTPLTHTSHPERLHTPPCPHSGAPTLESRVHLPSE